jgi:hypothetical protein
MNNKIKAIDILFHLVLISQLFNIIINDLRTLLIQDILFFGTLHLLSVMAIYRPVRLRAHTG